MVDKEDGDREDGGQRRRRRRGWWTKKTETERTVDREDGDGEDGDKEDGDKEDGDKEDGGQRRRRRRGWRTERTETERTVDTKSGRRKTYVAGFFYLCRKNTKRRTPRLQEKMKSQEEERMEAIRSQVEESMLVKRRLSEDESMMRKIAEAAGKCVEAYRNGRKTMWAGNGGSAADAQHLAGEMVSRFLFDRPGLPSIALTTDTSILTAIGNDYGYERLFARQVEAQGEAGDVFIGISTSGNSRNLVEALQSCREKGITTVALTGKKACKMDEWDIVIKVPSEETPRIQECQTLIGHILCGIVEEELFGGKK